MSERRCDTCKSPWFIWCGRIKIVFVYLHNVLQMHYIWLKKKCLSNEHKTYISGMEKTKK